MKWIERIPQSHSLLKSYLEERPLEMRRFAYSTMLGVIDIQHDPRLVMLALDQLRYSRRASSLLMTKLEEFIDAYSNNCTNWGFQSSALDQIIEALVSVIITTGNVQNYRRVEMLLDNEYPISVQSNLFIGLAECPERFNVNRFLCWVEHSPHPHKVYALAVIWEMKRLGSHKQNVIKVANKYICSECYYAKLSSFRILAACYKAKKNLRSAISTWDGGLMYSDRKLVREAECLLTKRTINSQKAASTHISTRGYTKQ